MMHCPRIASRSTGAQPDRCGDEGYLLIGVLILVFLMLLTLSVAAPRVAMQLKHEKEIETQHRANQYVRAIRMYYRKNQSYPASIKVLENSNNQKFLRQHYIDPMTGKDDWRLIEAGKNKTQVKGFFGQDLPGMASGLDSAAGLSSSSGNSTSGTGSAFGSSSFGSSSAGGGTGSGSTSSFGSSSPPLGSRFNRLFEPFQSSIGNGNRLHFRKRDRPREWVEHQLDRLQQRLEPR